MGDLEQGNQTKNTKKIGRVFSRLDVRCVLCGRHFNRRVRANKKYCNWYENKYCYARYNTMLKREERARKMEREKEGEQIEVETETFYDLLKALEIRVKKLEMIAGIRNAIISN